MTRQRYRRVRAAPCRLLPAYLVAAFVKRLAQLALLAPPQAALTNLALIYNLLLRHPACVLLIHRDAAQGLCVHTRSGERRALPASC